MKIDGSKIKKYLISRTALGILLGGTGGFMYYYFIGCASGTCPITSNPYISIVYGTLIGGLLLYKPKKKVSSDSGNQE